MNSNNNDLDLEEIAAFLDGKLRGEARARVIEQLADSDVAFDVFASAAAASLAESSTGLSRRWRAAATVAGLAAAASLAVLVAPTALEKLRGPEPLQFSATETIRPLTSSANLEAAVGAGWGQHNWAVTRGPSGMAEPALVFRVGVRSMDLRIALEVDDRARAVEYCTDLVNWLGEIEFAEPLVARYTDLRRRIAIPNEETSTLILHASSADQATDELIDSPLLPYGKWCGAAELAAQARNADFFRSPETRRVLAAIERGEIGRDDPDAARLVEVIRARPVDFDEVVRSLQSVIRRNGG